MIRIHENIKFAAILIGILACVGVVGFLFQLAVVWLIKTNI